MPAVQIPCEECGCRRTAVVMTRQLDDHSLVRRRKCIGCEIEMLAMIGMFMLTVLTPVPHLVLYD